MSTTNPAFRDFSAHTAENAIERERFRHLHADVIAWMDWIVTNYSMLHSAADSESDVAGKKRTPTAPLLTIMQQQTLTCFDAMINGRPHLAMQSLRPALEAALIIGKFLDDEDNASIFFLKDASAHQFNRSFAGTGLISRSINSSAGIQAHMKQIDDSSITVNPEWYARIVNAGMVAACEKRDADEVLLQNVTVILRLLLQTQEDLMAAYNAVFGCDLTLEHGLQELSALGKNG